MRDKFTGQFLKGFVQNPNGRPRIDPKMKVLKNAIRALVERPDGTNELAEILVDGARKMDSTCLRLACEHGYGKPKQYVEVESCEGWTDSELFRAAKEIFQSMEEVQIN